jgi:hypothetical protein
MSSHREAPQSSKDPVADNTDVYAFVSPERPDTVTLIANFIPFQAPDAGPNFFEFGDDVLYQIYIRNGAGSPDADIAYQFRFSTVVRNPNTFLYNTGPISSLTDPNWNRPQTYSVTKVTAAGSQVLASGLTTPPCNVGVRSTPNYAGLAGQAIHGLPSGETVFAGQRADGFYVDVGSIFDLGTLRPFENLHLIKTPAAPGVNSLGNLNVHTIALQVPKTLLTRNGSNPTDPASATSVIGVWASASRRRIRLRDQRLGIDREFGSYAQVSRLANPLFNEVVVPMARKDNWNALYPRNDDQFLQYVQKPELAGLLPVLYPTVFPNLAALNASGAARADLAAILLTGLPSGIIPGFQNYTGPSPMDLVRLNMAIAPTPTASADIRGILGGDLAGFPNGRRVFDDVTTIELRAIAGATYPLVAPSYTPDGAASLITQYNSTMNPAKPANGAAPPLTASPSVKNDGTRAVDASGNPTGTIPIPPVGFYSLNAFPYLGTPYDGYSYPFEPAS